MAHMKVETKNTAGIDKKPRVYFTCHPEDPDTLTSLSDLAVTYAKLNELEKALSLRRTVYELRMKVLGPDHPDTKDALQTLIRSLENTGRHEEAQALKKG